MRSSITIVASPRPRVGKTLLARVLADYLVQGGRKPLGFDLGGGEGGLSDYLPEYAALASLDDVKAQMSFFDTLIAGDGQARIVDLGADLFEDFFKLASQFGLADETRARDIGIGLMYIVTPDRTSLHAARALQRHFPDMTLTPVHNEIFGPPPHRQIDSIHAREPLLKLPSLAPAARKYVDQAPFSFAADCGHDVVPPSAAAEIEAWLRRIHRDLRELQLRSFAPEAQPVRIGS